MPHIAPCPPADASDEARGIYEDFQRGMGIPAAPNFITTQGHAPNVARGSWLGVRSLLLEGSLARWIKELILVAISADRDCVYCAAAHAACCNMLNVNPEWIEAAADDVQAITDPKLRDMILFCVKCARNPQSLAPQDFSVLRGHGLREPEILELVGMAGLAVYVNIIADATAMSNDAMFSPAD